MPSKFDKGTKRTLDDLRDKLSGSGDIIDKIIDDANERRH